ncbi:MAG: DUF554 domain-containing protein [Clostridia bacterium]|nr:DUF554 domain-containing protein [Clostridia bacterium]
MGEILTSFSGVLVNTVTVIIGSAVGLLLKKGIPERLNKAVMTAIGLCTIAIGVTGIMKGQNQLVMILSMVFGTIVGTLIDIDKRLERLGEKLAKKSKSRENTFSQGFVTASLLFCVGAMTIVGSMNAGISGDNEMLYTKSVLDLISSSMLAASLGFGVMCASGFVLVFQGALVALSMVLGSFLSDFAVAELICAGSVMITALGLNLIGVTKIKVANLLPGLIFVPLFCSAFELLGI